MSDFLDPTSTILVSDIDECLARTTDALISFVWDTWGVLVPYSAIYQFRVYDPVYDYIQRYALNPPTMEQFEAAVRAACWNNPQFYRGIQPYYVYAAALHRFKLDGGTVRFATHRGKVLESVTHEWLGRWGFGNDGRAYASHDHSRDKEDILEDYVHAYTPHRVIFVEDHLKTALTVWEKVPEVEVWLRAHPWNKQGGVDWREAGLPSLRQYADMPARFERLTESQIVSRINDGIARTKDRAVVGAA